MKIAPLNSISAFIGTAILAIFVVALAASISEGFAGFWGGLPFWLIILFVMYLALYNFLEESVGIKSNIRLMLIMLGIVYAGGCLAFGAWKASGFVDKFNNSTFSLPFSDTEHMLPSVWMQGFWMVLAIAIIIVTAYYGMKTVRTYSQQT